jgi:hypothetical protein
MNLFKAKLISKRVKAVLRELTNDPTCFHDDLLIHDIVDAIVRVNTELMRRNIK